MAFYPCLHLALSEVLHLLLLHLTICSQGNPSKVFTAIHLGHRAVGKSLTSGLEARDRETKKVKRYMKLKGVV